MINFFISLCIVLFALTVIFVVLSVIVGNISKKIKSILNWLLIHHLIELVILLTTGFIVFISIVLNKSHFYTQILKEISPKDGMGQFGDFFNGILAPFLTLISILLLYRAFKQQFIANNLFQNYELEKTIKEDLIWLRNKTKNIMNKRKDFLKMSDEELKDFFHPNNNFYLKELTYVVGVFKRNLTRIEIDRATNLSDNLELIKQDLIEILNVYYLSDLKDAFRRIGRFCKNNENIEFKTRKIETDFIIEFISLYELIENQTYKDNSFKLNIKSIKELINNSNHE